MTPSLTRCVRLRILSLLAALCLGSALFAAHPAAAQGQSLDRAGNIELCKEQLTERYGAVEFGKTLERRNNNRHWVVVEVTQADGGSANFRCQIRYGRLRGVTSYRGGQWGEAREVPKPEPEAEPEQVATRKEGSAEAATPEEGAEPPAEGERAVAGAGAGSAEAETEGAPAEGEAADGAAEGEAEGETAEGAPAEGEGEQGEGEAAEEEDPNALPVAESKTYRIGLGQGYSPVEGVTCYRKRRACYVDETGRLDLGETSRQFP